MSGPSLRVNIDGNQSGFQQVLNSVRNEGKKLSEEWSGASLSKRLVQGGAAYLGFEAIKASFESFIQRASGLRELADQLEMGTEQTQKWQKAADQLGMSFGTVQNVLMAIGQKRLEAAFDPKAAEQFERMGINRRAVLNTEKVDASSFAEMVLRSAGSGGRSVFGEMFGPRALKAIPAVEKFSGAVADFSEEAIQGAHEAEISEKKVGSVIGRMWGNIVRLVVFLGEGFEKTPKVQRTAADDAVFARKFGFDAPVDAAAANKKAADDRLNAEPVKDPLASLRADKALERDSQIDAAERGQHSQERQLMTIGKRRVSIMQDLLRVRRQIEQEEMRTAPDTLKSEEERADWEAKRTERLAGLRGQLAGLTGESREHPLFSGGGDSLSKVGLFSSASALAFPPGTGIAGDIKQIASNTWKMAHREDPHAP